MSTNISVDEELLTLTEASHRLPGCPCASSIWRWYRRGIRGVKLETLAIASRRYTSVEAIRRFIAATTAAADGQPVPVRTARRRRQAIEAAERELGREGVGRCAEQ
ncbi:MAG: DUF1580 domain-containing protein [Thermoguttaceae bacterium]|jgi:hypothetical protein